MLNKKRACYQRGNYNIAWINWIFAVLKQGECIVIVWNRRSRREIKHRHDSKGDKDKDVWKGEWGTEKRKEYEKKFVFKLWNAKWITYCMNLLSLFELTQHINAMKCIDRFNVHHMQWWVYVLFHRCLIRSVEYLFSLEYC